MFGCVLSACWFCSIVCVCVCVCVCLCPCLSACVSSCLPQCITHDQKYLIGGRQDQHNRRNKQHNPTPTKEHSNFHFAQQRSPSSVRAPQTCGRNMRPLMFTHTVHVAAYVGAAELPVPAPPKQANDDPTRRRGVPNELLRIHN